MTQSVKTIDVTALGEILIDFTMQGVNSQNMNVFAQYPGGAPGNVCVQVSRLGGQVAFMGKVGLDMHGRLLKTVLDQEGISTRNLIEDPEHFTTLAFVSVDENGEREFSFARKPGADTQICFEELDLNELQQAKIFHVGSLSLTAEPACSTTLQAIDYAKKCGALISYDPNYRASLWPDEETAIEKMRSLISSADLMKISDEETELLTGKADPEEAARALVEQGVTIAVITLGKDGALAATKDFVVRAGGFKSQLADTNGAGDSFWGSFLEQIARSPIEPGQLDSKTLGQMLENANACAALTVQKPGAIPAMPAAAEVNAFLEASGRKAAF